MTIEQLIDILKLLPGECDTGSIDRKLIHWFGYSVGSWECNAQLEKDGLVSYTKRSYGGDHFVEEGDPVSEFYGSIHDPDFRAKFCAFLKEHFAH